MEKEKQRNTELKGLLNEIVQTYTQTSERCKSEAKRLRQQVDEATNYFEDLKKEQKKTGIKLEEEKQLRTKDTNLIKALRAQVLTLEEKLEKEKVNSQIAVRKNEELLNKERQRNLDLEELLKKMAQEKAQRESIALENVRAYKELKRGYKELYEQYEGTTMTLEAERVQVLTLEERLERLKKLENEPLQEENEKLQEKFIRIIQELHQTQKRCESEATRVFDMDMDERKKM